MADAEQLAGLLEPVISAAGMDLESVRIKAAGRRQLLRIVVDSDGGVSLDGIAELSRELSAHLDAGGAMGDTPYTLEVSSPGVERPLTEPRHWRRARGRLVAVSPSGPPNSIISGETDTTGPVPPPIQGRVVVAGDNGVTLDVDGRHRRFSYAELGPGRVQVEFGKLDGDPRRGSDDGTSGADDTDGAAGAAAARSGKRGSPDGH